MRSFWLNRLGISPIKWQSNIWAIRKIGFGLGTTGLANMTNFLLLIVIGRYLGDILLGQFSLMIGIVTTLTFVSDLGLTYLIHRDVARNQEASSDYFIYSAITRVTFGLISFIIPTLYINLSQPEKSFTLALIIACIASLSIGLFQTTHAIFIALEMFDVSFFLRLGLFVVQLPLIALGIVFGGKLIIIFLIYLLTYTGMVILTIWWYRRIFLRSKHSIQIPRIFSLLRQAWPFAILIGFYPVFYRLNIFILSLLTEDMIVGWYTKALSIREIIVLLAISYETITFPSLSKKYNDKEAFRQRFVILLRQFGLVAFLSAILLFFGGGIIIKLIYGSDSLVSEYQILRILTLGIPIFFISHLLRSIIRATHNQRPQVILSIALIIIHAFLSVLFILQWSYLGAAISLVLADSIGLVFLLIITHGYWSGINWTKALAPGLIAAILLCLLIYLCLGQSIILQLK